MAISEQLDKDLQLAQKARDAGAVSILRLLTTALKYERIRQKAELNEEDVIKILRTEIKKRKEAIGDYAKGGRQDLVAKEQSEIDFIAKYLPAQLSQEEIRTKVKAILQSMGIEENSGKLLGKVMAELKGQADGNLVRQIVEEETKNN